MLGTLIVGRYGGPYEAEMARIRADAARRPGAGGAGLGLGLGRSLGLGLPRLIASGWRKTVSSLAAARHPPALPLGETISS